MNAEQPTSPPDLRRRLRRLLPSLAALAWAGALLAAPVPLDDAPDPPSLSAVVEEDVGADAPATLEAHAAIEREAVDALIQQQAERDRAALLQQDFMGRPPTWIQTASVVNLAEYPALADPSEDAERALRTLEWLIAERNREAVARAGRAERGERSATRDDVDPPWWRTLLPAHWVPVLKAHREAVIGASVGALALVWMISILAQRPPKASKSTRKGDRSRSRHADATRRRRRRRRRSSSSPDTTAAGTTAAAPVAPAMLRS